jgi:hypothetical protein
MTAKEKEAFKRRMAAGRANASTALAVVPKSKVTYLAAPPPAPKKSLARRVGSAAVVYAVQEKEMVATILTAGAIGYLEQEGWLEEMPLKDALPIGAKGMLAIFTYGASKYLVKDPELKKILMGVSQAAGTIATYELVRAFTAKRQLEAGLPSGKAAGEGHDAAGV